jgi:triosephosphate isomerase
MRKQIVGGNWKMNIGSPKEAKSFVEKLIPIVKELKNVDIIIAPPFTALNIVSGIVKNSNLNLSAQNMYFEDNGAFTGDISPIFLKDIGCNYVILGHSERRNIFRESDDLINKKLRKALQIGLNPIVCIGEHLEEREQGKTEEIIEYQLKNTFKDLSKEDFIKSVIAYEAIWAIGTGKTATPEQAEEVHRFIRDYLVKIYNLETAEKIRIQYGGSIKPNNAKSLFNQPNIDGGLVGGASLKLDSFFEILKAANEVKK